MELISRNRISEYFERYPNAQTALLIWFKEFKYNTMPGTRAQPTVGLIKGERSFPKLSYHIQYHINPWLCTAYIVWFGSDEELMTYRSAELERFKAANPNVVLQQKTVTLTVPAHRPAKNKANHILPSAAETVIEPVNYPLPEEEDVALLDTPAKYAQALSRAIAIFGSKPGMIEFDELASLIVAIRIYERKNITLPGLSVAQLINTKMEERGLTPRDVARNIGITEARAILILEGRKAPTAKMLSLLEKRWKIPYAISDLCSPGS